MAHPEWPYSGTAHEWRGFVKDESRPKPTGRVTYGFFGQAIAVPDETVYQKQNFGPELK
jgi:hypothetical protein